MTSAINNSPNRPFLLIIRLLFFNVTILGGLSLNSVSAVCELSYKDHHKLYNYSLASPLPNFPHGVLSEDGLALPAMRCNAFSTMIPLAVLTAGNAVVHHAVAWVVAHWWRTRLEGIQYVMLLDVHQAQLSLLWTQKKPHMGVIVKMASRQPNLNCSLSVSVVCDSHGVRGPQTLDKVGTCDYTTELRHPAGCANVISSEGRGWGWFGVMITIILCLFGGYLLAGAVYRYFFLNIRGIDIIPNLEFWASLPHRVQSWFMSLVRRFRGPSQGYRSSYSPVNF